MDVGAMVDGANTGVGGLVTTTEPKGVGTSLASIVGASLASTVGASLPSIETATLGADDTAILGVGDGGYVPEVGSVDVATDVGLSVGLDVVGAIVLSSSPTGRVVGLPLVGSVVEDTEVG